MPREPWSPAYRRYQIRAAVAMGLYVVTILGAATLAKGHAAGNAVLALAPALCVVAVVVALGRYVAEEQDEYLRLRIVLQILWATGGALAITTVWGFEEAFTGLAHLPLYFAAVIWFGCFGVASAAARMTRR